MARLRCFVCGGPAFDCACVSVGRDAAEVVQFDALPYESGRVDCVMDRRIWRVVALFSVLCALVLVAFPSEAQTCPDPAASSVTLVLPVAFSLSAEDGYALGMSIVVIWAAAYAWRMAIKALDVADRGDAE